MGHLNIRSLKKGHLIEIRKVVQDNNYDIFAISESWVTRSISNAEVKVEGFKLTRLDRSEKTGGGVCLYTHTYWKIKVLKELTAISDSGFHQLWMKVQYKKLKMFLLGVTYRPPDCPVASFTDAFVENYMQALIHGKDIFILGDLNCDLLKSTPESRNFKTIFA